MQHYLAETLVARGTASGWATRARSLVPLFFKIPIIALVASPCL